MTTVTEQQSDLDEIMQILNSGKCTIRERMTFLKKLTAGQIIASAEIKGSNALVVRTPISQDVIPDLDRFVYERGSERVCIWAMHNGQRHLVLQLRYIH